MLLFCWQFSSGVVPGPPCAALLGSPTWTSVILPKSPPCLSSSLLSSVIQPRLFNAVDFRRVVQEFKLLRNTSISIYGCSEKLHWFLSMKAIPQHWSNSRQLNKTFNELLLFGCVQKSEQRFCCWKVSRLYTLHWVHYLGILIAQLDQMACSQLQ